MDLCFKFIVSIFGAKYTSVGGDIKLLHINMCYKRYKQTRTVTEGITVHALMLFSGVKCILTVNKLQNILKYCSIKLL